MRIIINVKYRRGSVHLETRMDQSSTDKVAEINAAWDRIKRERNL